MTRLRRDGSGARPSGRTALIVVAVLGSLALAACGSQLDPDTIARANGTTNGVQGAAVPGSDSGLQADGTVPGAGAPGDPGTVGDPGTASGPGTSPGDSAGDPPAGENAPGGNTKAGSCEGFDNDQTGVTSDKISIANVSDISGPVPGIFESAQQATRAYAEYFNASSDICGHKLDVQLLDSRADAGADQQAYAKACDEAFAAVGSMSAFDSGGAATAADCGLPDLRSTSVTPERHDCATCFAAQSVSTNLVPTSMPKYWIGKNKSATEHVALLYINVGAASINSQSFQKGWETSGWNVDYFQGIDVSEFNYAPYVQQMKDKGIKMVVYVGPYQNTVKLQQAMKQQGFEPDVFLQDSTIYDEGYVEQAGSDGDGTYAYSTTAMFDNTSLPEMALYRSWLDQVSPGAVPNYYGLYAWSATRLFVEQAVALGGKLNRKTLVSALAQVKNWTSNGLHASQQVGSKVTTNCVSIIQLNDGKWSKISPGDYMCGPLTNTGIGD